MPNYPAGVTFPAYRGRFTLDETIDDVPVEVKVVGPIRKA